MRQDPFNAIGTGAAPRFDIDRRDVINVDHDPAQVVTSPVELTLGTADNI